MERDAVAERGEADCHRDGAKVTVANVTRRRHARSITPAAADRNAASRPGGSAANHAPILPLDDLDDAAPRNEIALTEGVFMGSQDPATRR